MFSTNRASHNLGVCTETKHLATVSSRRFMSLLADVCHTAACIFSPECLSVLSTHRPVWVDCMDVPSTWKQHFGSQNMHILKLGPRVNQPTTLVLSVFTAHMFHYNGSWYNEFAEHCMFLNERRDLRQEKGWNQCKRILRVWRRRRGLTLGSYLWNRAVRETEER